MSRVKGGVVTHARHKKVIKAAKGYYGRRKNTFKVAAQAVDKANQYASEARSPARGQDRALIPHLKGLRAPDLARAIAQGQTPKLSFNGIEARLALPKHAAPLLAAIDGRRSLSEIAQATGTDPIAFGSLWAQIERDLADHGLLLYSGILRT